MNPRVPDDDALLKRWVAANRELPPVDDLAGKRIWRRLQARSIIVDRRSVWKRLSLAAILIFGSGGTVGATVMALYKQQQHSAATVAGATPESSKAAPPPRRPAHPTNPTDPKPLKPRPRRMAILRSPPAQDQTSEVVASVREAPTADEQPAPGTVVDEEADSFANILRSLRRQRNVPQALMQIKNHEGRWPGGRFAQEVDAAHLEALLNSSKEQEALSVLDKAQVPRGPRGTELRVLRGELRAKHHRCVDAANDFEHVLADSRDVIASLRARALFGLGVCQQHLGKPEAARHSFESYVRLYPNGAGLQEAKRAVGYAGK